MTAVPAPTLTQRLMSAAAPDLGAHARQFGAIPWRGSAGALVPELEDSGLAGRGGAGFPSWRKVTAVAQGRRAVVVANAAEGEPASAKDAMLLTHAPHLVLDGLQLAAEAVNADSVFLYVKAGPGQDAARRALQERSVHDWDRFPVTVHEAPKGFVSGEETSVISALEGGLALPRFKRKLAVESGVGGRPTLVQNAETLAHVGLIARYGAGWFRQTGTDAEPGTFLATVSGAVVAPGVVESEYGVRLGDLLGLAGGPAGPLRAVLIGGYHGAWLTAPQCLELPVSRAALRPYGASPGAGVVIALPADSCGLEYTARVAQYLAGESARQCAPCVNGLPAMALALSDLADPAAARGDSGRLTRRVDQLVALVEGRGVCHHPDGTVRLVRSALATFADDVAAHLAGRCLAAAR